MLEPQHHSASRGKGRCNFCGLIRPESGMARHLQSCSRRRHAFCVSPNGAISYHIFVIPPSVPHTWKHLEVPGDLKLALLAEEFQKFGMGGCAGFFRPGEPLTSGNTLISEFFVPGLVAHCSAAGVIFDIQVISLYDGRSTSQENLLTVMAESLASER